MKSLTADAWPGGVFRSVEGFDTPMVYNALSLKRSVQWRSCRERRVCWFLYSRESIRRDRRGRGASARPAPWAFAVLGRSASRGGRSGRSRRCVERCGPEIRPHRDGRITDDDVLRVRRCRGCRLRSRRRSDGRRLAAAETSGRGRLGRAGNARALFALTKNAAHRRGAIATRPTRSYGTTKD